jgi:hypothetical protein
VLGLQEELGKCRMCLVSAPWVESYFCIAGYVQGAEPIATIGQREPADLRLRVGNHCDLVTSLNLSVTAANDGAVQSQFCLVFVSLDADRLAARRPDAASVEIAYVTILAPVVAGDVFSPASHVCSVNDAVTTPRNGY